MADKDSKTEKATPKKREDAKKEGQVLSSNEVVTAFCSVVMFGFLLAIFPSAVEQMTGIFIDFLSPSYVLSADDIAVGDAQGVLRDMILVAARLVLPLMGLAMLAGLAVNFLQVGFLFTTKPLQPKLERISPLKGFKRMFSLSSIVELIKSLGKVIVLGYIVASEYMKLLSKFPALMGTDVYLSYVEIMKTAFQIALKLCLVLAILAIFDYLYRWWKHEKDLMMSKQEIKDEYKNIEGDPQIKGKIKQKQRQMSAMRMMDRVPTADVVITNPTHYAVALKYEDGKSNAPVVVAKGQDFIARKIKETAREHGVHIVENRPLAQSLYAMCDIDEEIPAEFYQAVADILVFVYKQKNRAAGRAGR